MLMRDLEKNHRKILIAGDNCILRRGISAVVCSVVPDAAIVEARNVHKAGQELGLARFCAGFFDLEMSDASAPSFYQTLRLKYPDLILTVISRDDRASTILNYLAVGVNGYVLGCCNQREIERAIETILNGAIYVPPAQIRSRAYQRGDDPSRQISHPARNLTRRQENVLELLQNGLSNKAIARKLHLSPNTIKIHVSALLRHFAVQTRSDLINLVQGEHRGQTYSHGDSFPPRLAACVATSSCKS
jgi:DNA-binding NarL/FixJ family response regulator